MDGTRASTRASKVRIVISYFNHVKAVTIICQNGCCQWVENASFITATPSKFIEIIYYMNIHEPDTHRSTQTTSRLESV